MGSKGKTMAGVSAPVGYRFHPTEEELLSHYLQNKIHDLHFKVNHIREIDLYSYDPWDLRDLSVGHQDSDEWFFFGRPVYKSNNSTRAKRTTPKGYWKITGQGRDIKARHSKAIIGRKRTLTFYGRAPNLKKTNWVMHEYHLNKTQPNLSQRDFVLYRVKKNPDKKGASIRDDGDVGEPSSCNESNFGDQIADVVTPESQDYSSTTIRSSDIELEDVLQANGINNDCHDMQSPFNDNNHYDTNHNDISTCDEREPPSLVWIHDMNQELCARSEQERVSFLHIDISNEEYKKSHENEFFNYIASEFENQAADNMILEQSYIELNDDQSKWQCPPAVMCSRNDFHQEVNNLAFNNENQNTYGSNYEVYLEQEESLGLICWSPKEHDYTLSHY